MFTKIQKTAAWLRKRLTNKPSTAIILGSGLGELASEIQIITSWQYKDIPYFPISTVEGHEGRLIVGKLAGKEVIAMEGRFHYYEGYTIHEVTFPIRVFHELGIKNLFVSNAAGGTNPHFHIGDIMVLTDHINHLPENPLRGPNNPVGPRFLDMSEAYDKKFIELARSIAKEKNITLRFGVYLATSGPTYETPAEYRMYHVWGADAVGMSTVPEVIVARHCGIRCFGISVITDLGVDGKIENINHEKVQQAARSVQPILTTLFKEMIKQIND